MSTLLDTSRKQELIAAAVISVAMLLLTILVQRAASPALTSTPEVIAEIEPIGVFPDFASIRDVDVKKQQFFGYLQDYIEAENIAQANARKQLLIYAEIVNRDVSLSQQERELLLPMVETYRLRDDSLSEKEIVRELLLRVDQIPASLVLAQAANESAWGTSRFVVEGNNIFGQWCYVEGCGIVPKRRVSGATHEVKVFSSVQEAVRAYFININSNQSYGYLRELRACMRDQQQTLDSLVLAYGLGAYSQRGDQYVDEVQTLILQNDLRRRDKS